MRRIMHKLLSLLTVSCLLLTLAAPMAAAAGSEITIETVSDFLNFAKNCALDSWSQGKTVRLTADLDLTQADFAAIPTFGGTFDGQEHTITGLKLTNSGSKQGLFRTVQKGGVVRNLNVSGTVTPDGTQTDIGGIVGVNYGSLENCTFTGNVKGKTNVGGVAGRNETTGRIAGCSASGTVQGQGVTGGIVGRNLGTLLKCTNKASVNTEEQDSSRTITELDQDMSSIIAQQSLDSLNDSDGVLSNNIRDTGGITGYSSGVVQSCVNNGAVGYPHIGYNVGGIAGRQDGFLTACQNTGYIQGRKDVGGIVGQAEPWVTLHKSETLEEIESELDRLIDLIDRAIDDAKQTGDSVSDHLTTLGDYADDARENAHDLSDRATDLLNENIDAVNDLSAAMTGTLDLMSPAMDKISDAARQLSDLMDDLNPVLDELDDLTDSADDVTDKLDDAISNLKSSAENAQTAANHVKKAIQALQGGIISGDQEKMQEILETQLKPELASLSEALQKTAEEIKALLDLPDPPKLKELLEQLKPQLEEVGTQLSAIGASMKELASCLTWNRDRLDTAKDELNKASTAGQLAARRLVDALDDLQRSMDYGSDFGDDLSDVLKDIADLTGDASHAGRTLADGMDGLKDAIDYLRENGDVSFTPIDDDFRASGDRLFDTMELISNEMGNLQDTLDHSSDVITADLRAISDQSSKVFHLMLDEMKDLRDTTEKTLDDYFDDTSEENISATKEGKVADSENSGTVEGDRNVGGIVGSIGIEYDLDPEDDIDRYTFGSTYETKAVVQGCLNRGDITAKKDCVGGLVGRMDLGTVISGQNYGAIESTNGNYVGGVAGYADASVRGNYAKCTLTGKNYLGGIVGWGSRLLQNTAIATISEDGEEYLGAVAGDFDFDDGTIKGNRFVETNTAAIDGVSYAGKAEPVTYDALRKESGVPAEFISFTLTLRTEDEIVAQIPFQYGENLRYIQLPEVPEQEGQYGKWPEFDLSGVQSDITVEAEYHPWVTLVASYQRNGSLAVALADGQFTDDALLSATPGSQTPPETNNGPEPVETSVWDICLSGTDLTDIDIVPIRLLNSDGGTATVWQYVDGAWQKVDARQSGHYLLLNMTGTTGTFCVQTQEGSSLWMWLGIGGAGAAGLVVIVVLGKVLRKKKAKKSAKTAKSEKSKKKQEPAGKT